jgi:predicted CXXCH cytochrome family protein
MWGGGGSLAVAHPQVGDASKLNAQLKLVASTSGGERIGCRTCHDPHARHADNPALLRDSEGGGSGLCTKCHSDMHAIELTSHSAESLVRAGHDATGCRPCHSVHANAATLESGLLWPKALSGVLPSPSDGSTYYAADRMCLGCHGPGGNAPQPAIASHPNVPMVDLAAGSDRSALPLFTETGEASASGRLACRTCHLPHGRSDAAELAAGLAPEVRRAARLQIRPFETPNACTSCHSADALQRFLYFHDPARRSGAIGTR